MLLFRIFQNFSEIFGAFQISTKFGITGGFRALFAEPPGFYGYNPIAQR